MYQKKDRSSSILCSAVGVVLILSATSAIPSFEVNGFQVKRVNLLSSFVVTNGDITVTSSSSEWVEGDKLISTYSEKTVRDIKPETVVPDEIVVPEVVKVYEHLPEMIDNESGIVDYSPSGSMIGCFIQKLYEESSRRNVRIAFLGDSFIEGDILTSSFRDALQSEFGGEGVGFVPFADPISKYRTTVKQEFSGWQCYNLLRKKNVPERYKDDFYFSGYVCVPSPGARAEFVAGSYNGRRLSSSHARIFFKNRGEGRMDVVVNGRDTLNYLLERSDSVQCIDICRDEIEMLAVALPECNDFVGYGVAFEGDTGVTIDNYALRSHNGTSLLSTSFAVNSQMDRMMNYDLVVMEYGLNAMQKSVTQYKNYLDKMGKSVEYVQRSFPGSAIMLLSVGDVGMKVDNQVITAPAVPAMVGGQRLLAQNRNILFLNLFREMGGEGSMKMYVDKGWASKDYLHINFKGGKQIAQILLDVIHDRPEYKAYSAEI